MSVQAAIMCNEFKDYIFMPHLPAANELISLVWYPELDIWLAVFALYIYI